MNDDRPMARMTNYRWPKAECLHEDTRGPTNIVNGFGQIVRTYPEKCLDCGAKQTSEGWR